MQSVQDYRLVGCGCCTGRTVDRGEGFRIADDQCVCWMHQDTTRGQPARKCSVHRTPDDLDEGGAYARYLANL